MDSYDSQFLFLMVLSVVLALFFPFFVVYVAVRKSPPVKEILGSFAIFCLFAFWGLGLLPAIMNWDLDMFFDALISSVGGESNYSSNKVEYKSFDTEYWESSGKKKENKSEFGDVQFSFGE